MLKKVKIDDAVGMVLGHDMTKVIPGEYKGAAFRRGHVIKQEDIPELLDIGKRHIFVIELAEDEVHEEEAALRIAKAVSGPNMELSQPSEGRVNIIAKSSGLLKVNVSLLREVNAIGQIVLATRHNNTTCQPGTMVAGTKIIPLYISETKLNELEDLCREKGIVLEIIPCKTKKVGVVITGNEVFTGRIKDRFGETVRRKVQALGSEINHEIIVPDDEALIAQAIIEMRDMGSEVIMVCGGLSVDPDDVTVQGVQGSGAEIINYGAPVMPGVMFLYAILQGIPIIGVPAAAIFNETTIIDVILPRVMADDKIYREDILELGHGGLCLNCGECTFPICPFCR